MLKKFARLCHALGWWHAFGYILKVKCIDQFRAFHYFVPARGTLSARLAELPLTFRYGSSDASAFWQVFVCEEYREVCSGDPRVIVDCGANVGYTSAYFASRHPAARIFSFEPDLNNFEVLRLNLASFGGRVIPINQAVWSKPGPLRLVPAPLGSRDEWGVQVRECQPGETPDILANSLDALMKEHNLSHIDILKIDIEGAEFDLFSSGVDAWLPSVKSIIIELHGTKCRDIFEKTVSTAGFRMRDLGHRVVIAIRG